MNQVASEATATSYGKINVALRAGPVDAHGYHPLRTVFAAVSLPERVHVRASDRLQIEVVNDPHGVVPRDETNLAAAAARLMADRVGRDPLVEITIDKTVPVAGGMGGGSADAAATLLALNELWGMGLHRRQLAAMARPLGADVPFAVVGGTALGTGRGDHVLPIATSRSLPIALALQDDGISTARVYQLYDELHPGAIDPHADDDLVAGLESGDLERVGRNMVNDLEPVAFAVMPRLQQIRDAALREGALGAVVTGSGPTVAALGADDDHARRIAAAWGAQGLCARAVAVRSVPAE
ncbi:4-(cytidine 5'-diphospho)-2-C-methyl-D-erythritol kinase [Rarobacter incanus]|uniref:4-diphosphocytidyl-2-C-methyl-D-erythritol kinase n=1 Tax=Rarobacter incanus TaxID=153494 RepID=A0A542SQS2_9MICO|nr:4-(cytidine 5'-diphospho)-2-C-methyl-D-erythritol kinase [Rarobacter incanus]TQK76971.1 4-diphosphocytidyl-2-C-methyl-D-erythritol kinase [Rarobacter incanus]